MRSSSYSKISTFVFAAEMRDSAGDIQNCWESGWEYETSVGSQR
jgi:hypothetical protein